MRATLAAERRLHVAGVEVLLRANRHDVLDALVAGWRGYDSRGGAPGVVFEYLAIDGHLIEQPAGRAYPAYACEARSATEYAIARRDSYGTIEIPASPALPVTARLCGNPGRFALEAGLRVTFSLALPRLGGLLVHSGGIVVPGAGGERAFLFSGPSGSGKTTLTTLLAEAYPLARLGDDLTVARPDPAAPGRWRGHATPFAGEAGPAPGGDAPLAALYFLLKGTRHHATRLSPGDALGRLMRNVMAYVQEREAAARALAAATSLVRDVPCDVLEFTRDPGVTRVLAVT